MADSLLTRALTLLGGVHLWMRRVTKEMAVQSLWDDECEKGVALLHKVDALLAEAATAPDEGEWHEVTNGWAGIPHDRTVCVEIGPAADGHFWCATRWREVERTPATGGEAHHWSETADGTLFYCTKCGCASDTTTAAKPCTPSGITNASPSAASGDTITFTRDLTDAADAVLGMRSQIPRDTAEGQTACDCCTPDNHASAEDCPGCEYNQQEGDEATREPARKKCDHVWVHRHAGDMDWQACEKCGVRYLAEPAAPSGEERMLDRWLRDIPEPLDKPTPFQVEQGINWCLQTFRFLAQERARRAGGEE